MGVEAVAAGSKSTATDWVQLALGRAASPRTQRAARAITVGVAAWEVGRKIHGWARARSAYTVSVPGTDDLYDAVHDWLASEVPSDAQRAMVALTRRSSPNTGSSWEPTPVDEPEVVSVATALRTVYDGSAAQTVTIGGHHVAVEVKRDSRAEGFTLSTNQERGTDWFGQLQRLVFSCASVAARDAVVAFLADLASQQQQRTRTPRMWLANRWGGWKRVQDAPPRPASTVVLRDGLMDDLLADLDRFLRNEARYNALGIPWHRGYLFHGLPGTGKTSAAKALAHEFAMDVHCLSLSDMTADTDLLSMLGDVGARSMLVLEDIDVVHAAKSRDDESKRVSLSGLLNALDGFTTPHGLVTVMTTNDVSVLDPALIRPGRADRRVEFLPLDDVTAVRLMDLVGGSGKVPRVAPLNDATLTAADLLAVALPHIHDPEAAVEAMGRRLRRVAGAPTVAS